MSGFDSSDDETETSFDQSPFTIDWLDLSEYGCKEDLGISGLPGCRYKDTWRKLDSDIASVTDAGVAEVFVLCTRGELQKYRVPNLLSQISGAGLMLHHYPVQDGSTPTIAVLMKILNEVRLNLMQGRRTLVHCYGGLGRSGLVAVCLLMMLDTTIDAESAISRVRDLRGPGAINSIRQYNFVNDFREDMKRFELNCAESSRSVSR